MTSTSAVSMAMPLTSTNQKRNLDASFLKTLPMNPSKAIGATSSRGNSSLQVKASMKEKAVAGFTAAAMTAYMAMPEVAEAAGSGISPSLKNFLQSILAGGVVVAAILGAVIAVSNFDPVKRS